MSLLGHRLGPVQTVHWKSPKNFLVTAQAMCRKFHTVSLLGNRLGPVQAVHRKSSRKFLVTAQAMHRKFNTMALLGHLLVTAQAMRRKFNTMTLLGHFLVTAQAMHRNVIGTSQALTGWATFWEMSPVVCRTIDIHFIKFIYYSISNLLPKYLIDLLTAQLISPIHTIPLVVIIPDQQSDHNSFIVSRHCLSRHYKAPKSYPLLIYLITISLKQHVKHMVPCGQFQI